jgi:hypothetical protein
MSRIWLYFAQKRSDPMFSQYAHKHHLEVALTILIAIGSSVGCGAKSTESDTSASRISCDSAEDIDGPPLDVDQILEFDPESVNGTTYPLEDYGRQ